MTDLSRDAVEALADELDASGTGAAKLLGQDRTRLLPDAAATLRALLAENERLRGALGRIIEKDVSCWQSNPERNCHFVARAALGHSITKEEGDG